MHTRPRGAKRLGRETHADGGRARVCHRFQKSENSVFFEVDGPYRAMILPASKEEGACAICNAPRVGGC